MENREERIKYLQQKCATYRKQLTNSRAKGANTLPLERELEALQFELLNMENRSRSDVETRLQINTNKYYIKN